MPDPKVGQGKTLDDALKDAAGKIPDDQHGKWLTCTVSVKAAPTPVRISDYRVEISP